MQCPKCGFNVNDKDTFCENCGVVFADYQLLQRRQTEKEAAVQASQATNSQQKTTADPLQQQLASQYLCNTEVIITTSHANESENLAAQASPNPEFNSPANLENNSEENSKKTPWLVYLSLSFLIVIGIFGVYYFLIYK